MFIFSIWWSDGRCIANGRGHDHQNHHTDWTNAMRKKGKVEGTGGGERERKKEDETEIVHMHGSPKRQVAFHTKGDTQIIVIITPFSIYTNIGQLFHLRVGGSGCGGWRAELLQ